MNNLEKRIEKLEKSAGVGEREKSYLIIVTGGLDKEQTDAKIEAAIAEQLGAHPECSERDITVITVTDEETERSLKLLLAGERRGKLIENSTRTY